MMSAFLRISEKVTNRLTGYTRMPLKTTCTLLKQKERCQVNKLTYAVHHHREVVGMRTSSFAQEVGTTTSGV